MRKTKQVIVARKDLNMSPGKLAAQVAHASMGALLNMSYIDRTDGYIDTITLDLQEDTILGDWLNGEFTKICLSVDSEEALMEVYQLALEVGLPAKLIEDNGHTEFNGVKTKTCVGIGPGWIDDIDAVTGKLSLYK